MTLLCFAFVVLCLKFIYVQKKTRPRQTAIEKSDRDENSCENWRGLLRCSHREYWREESCMWVTVSCFAETILIFYWQLLKRRSFPENSTRRSCQSCQSPWRIIWILFQTDYWCFSKEICIYFGVNVRLGEGDRKGVGIILTLPDPFLVSRNNCEAALGKWVRKKGRTHLLEVFFRV